MEEGLAAMILGEPCVPGKGALCQGNAPDFFPSQGNQWVC